MKKELWGVAWGNPYDVDWKEETLDKELRRLDQEGKIGNVVLDVGSGAHPVSTMLKRPGRKIVQVDIAMPKDKTPGALKLKADIEKIDDDSLSSKKALLKVAQYLEVDPRAASKHQVDTILCSDILNYIDYRAVLERLFAYLKPGGYVVVFNLAGRGYQEFFSPKGVKSTEELLAFFRDQGFVLESAHDLHTTKPPYLLTYRSTTPEQEERT